MELPKQYGTYVKLWQGPNLLQIILSDPECIEQLLTSNVHLNKGAGYENFNAWLGQGLGHCKGKHLLFDQ